MTADRDLQHPDITEAERTGFPRRTFPPIPPRSEAFQRFIKENEQDFIDYCLDDVSLVEDYVFEHHDDFQEWQWDNFREVAY